MIILFWICVAVLLYTYVGYGMVVALLLFSRKTLERVMGGSHGDDKGVDASPGAPFEPEVTLVVAAYNERDCLEAKARNSFELDYPPDKLKFLFITDGSDDGTPELLRPFPLISVLHQTHREGKVACVNRAMAHVNTAVVVFSDANTLLNRSAIREIVKHYQDPQVGGVAGEKRVQTTAVDSASGAGEGLYWRYESLLKKMDAALYSVVGAAGELFSIRADLFDPVERGALLDDFLISLRIAQKGYPIAYEPNAYALETASASVQEEFKRKVRICAGGFQGIVKLRSLLNPFRYGWLSFQYLSHRVLRWTAAPLALLALIPINIILAYQVGGFFTWTLAGQLLFYCTALGGWLLENRKIRIKPLFIPFYFTMMNLAAYWGFFRFLTGRQSVLWEKIERRAG